MCAISRSTRAFRTSNRSALLILTVVSLWYYLGPNTQASNLPMLVEPDEFSLGTMTIQPFWFTLADEIKTANCNISGESFSDLASSLDFRFCGLPEEPAGVDMASVVIRVECAGNFELLRVVHSSSKLLSGTSKSIALPVEVLQSLGAFFRGQVEVIVVTLPGAEPEF